MRNKKPVELPDGSMCTFETGGLGRKGEHTRDACSGETSVFERICLRARIPRSNFPKSITFSRPDPSNCNCNRLIS